MSKTMKFVICIVMDLILAAMYYLWQVNGIERAGDVFMFMIWFCGIAGLVVFFVAASADQCKEKYAAHVWFSRFASMAFLIGTIWAGHTVAAVFYTLSWLIVAAHVDQCRKLVEAAK